MIVYCDIDICRRDIFPFIHRELTVEESAADYEFELNGMFELEKVLNFVREDGYYPTFQEKASYLICSIAGSQYFSNGNKRLSIMVLIKFLGLNKIPMKQFSEEDYQSQLKEYFPLSAWEEKENIQAPHAKFLYNLAILIGDRTQWGDMKFSDVKQYVAEIFKYLYL